MPRRLLNDIATSGAYLEQKRGHPLSENGGGQPVG